MPDQDVHDRALTLLDRPGIARSRDLTRDGVSRRQIRRLLERGQIEPVERRLYRRSGAPLSKRQDLGEVARRVPGEVVCLLSALRFHGLTTQNPFEVWLAIERKSWRPRVDFLRRFRGPVLSASSRGEAFERQWVAGGPWALRGRSEEMRDER